jgi:hypothetical protein
VCVAAAAVAQLKPFSLTFLSFFLSPWAKLEKKNKQGKQGNKKKEGKGATTTSSSSFLPPYCLSLLIQLRQAHQLFFEQLHSESASQ